MKKRAISKNTWILIVVVIVLLIAAYFLFFRSSGNVIFREYVEECTDSDVTTKYPDGISYGMKGNIRLEKISLNDHCNDRGELVEYYCDNGEIDSMVYVCADGCLRGKCKGEY